MKRRPHSQAPRSLVTLRHIFSAFADGFTFGFFVANTPLGFGTSQNSRSHRSGKWKTNLTSLADFALPALTTSAGVGWSADPPFFLIVLSRMYPNFGVLD